MPNHLAHTHTLSHARARPPARPIVWCLQAAITYNQPDLRDRCLAFIEENTPGVVRSKAFVEVSEDTFSYILQSDHLQIDEKSILDAVYHWGTVNSVVSGKTLGKQVEKVMEHVRFPLLGEASLQTVEEENLSHPKRQGTVPVPPPPPP